MRIFVGEYVCGGGLGRQGIEQAPLSMRVEGAAMLRAIAEDLSQVADTVIPLDGRLGLEIDGVNVVPTDPSGQLWAQWAGAARDCDAALVVAPENDGILAQGVAVLRAAGVDVIAGSGDFLRVASDKWQTAKTLYESGIAHPLSMTLGDRRHEHAISQFNHFVVKPRDGCASTDIRTFDSLDEATASLTDKMILQPRMPGQPISVSLVASGTRQTFLPAVRQTISDVNLSYQGGCGPLDADAQRRATTLASLAVSAMPPTVRGFVGIDVILGETSEHDCIVEINPRLSTSYVGLRHMTDGNLAARLFDLETGPVACSAEVESVRWTSSGQVWINDLAADHA